MRGNMYDFVELKIDVKELVPGRKKFKDYLSNSIHRMN